MISCHRRPAHQGNKEKEIKWKKSQIRGNWQGDGNLKYVGLCLCPVSCETPTCLRDFRVWDLVPKLSGNSQTLFSYPGTLSCAPNLREHCSGSSDIQQMMGMCLGNLQAAPAWICREQRVNFTQVNTEMQFYLHAQAVCFQRIGTFQKWLHKSEELQYEHPLELFHFSFQCQAVFSVRGLKG